MALKLRVITVKGVVYENEVGKVKIRRPDGLMIINKNYSSVLEQLADGEIVIYEADDKKVSLELEGGWLTVTRNRCNIYGNVIKFNQ